MGAAINTSTLEATSESLSLTSEIDEFKGARQVIGRIGARQVGQQAAPRTSSRIP